VNRRGFLSTLGIGGATLALDPERLLWRPGAKLISIPKPIIVDCAEDLRRQLQAIMQQQQFIINSFKGLYINDLLDVQDSPLYNVIRVERSIAASPPPFVRVNKRPIPTTRTRDHWFVSWGLNA
jgi:hypothetical protein